MSFNTVFLPYSLYYGTLQLGLLDREFDRSSLTYPNAANLVSGAFFGVSMAAIRFAAALISHAAQFAAKTLTERTVSWIVGAGAIATGAGEAASVIAAAGGLLLFFVANCAFFDAQSARANRVAKWVDGVATTLHWHSLLLNARSHFDLVTADHLNQLDDSKLPHVSARIVKRLPANELQQLNDRVLRRLSDDEINDLFQDTSSRSGALNERASENKDVSVDEINQLFSFEIRQLSDDVLVRIDDQDDLSKLSARVLNGLSPLTNVSLGQKIVRDLPDETKKQLAPHFLNGLNFDPTDFLASIEPNQLSARAVRWDYTMSMSDVRTLSIQNHIREGRRLYWVSQTPEG